MIKHFTLPLSDPQADLATVGGKGASLVRLVNAGLPVPDGFHVTTAAYQAFVDENALQPRILEVLHAVDTSLPATLKAVSAQIGVLFAEGLVPADVTAAAKAAYTALTTADEPVAVRSSATAEDLPDASFAGQHETFLNVHGVENVLDAVKCCWASLWTARAISYRMRQNIDHNAVSMAVVVQVLVPADKSGIMFTANPLHGRRDQIVISASWGLGDAVVGGLVTPDTFKVDKTNHTIITREIADKQTMTARSNGETEEQPVPELQRQVSSLEDAQVIELAQLGTEIEALYGMSMDIEWAIANDEISILQARPITALPEKVHEPKIEPPSEWLIPDPKAVYSRGSIVELMPDPLTPLFATLGVKAVNAGTKGLFTQVVGPDTILDDMVVTINDYAYFQMRLTLKFWWGLLIHVWSFLPQFFRGETRWREEARPQYLAVIERWKSHPLHAYTASELLDGVNQLAAEAVNIYNVYQSGVIGLAMVAEFLFTPFYEKLIRRKNDPPALTLFLGGDSMPIQAEKSLYDVAHWCREYPDLVDYLVQTPSAELAEHLLSDQPPLDYGDERLEWQHRFQTHLEKYGHAVYDLDFTNPVPADDPVPLLETLKLYLNDQIANPHERQQKQSAQREEAALAIAMRLKGLRLKWFRKLLVWAQKYVPMREDNLADIGLGYPLLRQMLRELGDRLVQASILEYADDVFWLYETEAIEAAEVLDDKTELSGTLLSIREKIRQRQAVWQAAKSVTPPAALPEHSNFTKMIAQFLPAYSIEDGDTLKGVGASPGRVTLPACVLHGPGDFDMMQPGAVLVAAITTPAWTPLFAMASAIVTDVGGPLSHGSIVAREYGIPAVLGTGVATKRIQSGQMITVDGDAGTVTLLDAVD